MRLFMSERQCFNLCQFLCDTIQDSNSSGHNWVPSFFSRWIFCHLHDFCYNRLCHLRHFCDLTGCHSLPGPGASLSRVPPLEAWSPVHGVLVWVSQRRSRKLWRHRSPCKCPISGRFYWRRAAAPGIFQGTGAPDGRGRRALKGFVWNRRMGTLISFMIDFLIPPFSLHFCLTVRILPGFFFKILFSLAPLMLLGGLPLLSALVALLQEAIVWPHMLGFLAQAAGPADEVAHNPSAHRLER